MDILLLFKAVSDETRARILFVLLHVELNVGEIVQVFRMSQPRISRHLKILSESGLLSFRRDGQWVFYKGSSEQGTMNEFLESFIVLASRDERFQGDLLRAREVIQERSRQSRKMFDSQADSWAAVRSEILGDLDLSAEIMKRMPDCEVAVDLGCGPGELLPLLLKRAFTVIGVDSSPGMLEQASQRTAGFSRVSLRLGELEHMPLGNDEANVAILSLVLHHLARPEDVLKETSRILKNNGKLILAELKRHDQEELRIRFGHRRLGFDSDELGSWFQEAGLMMRDSTEFEINNGLRLIVYETTKKEGGGRDSYT